MKNSSLKIPVILIAVGLVLAVLASLLTSIVKKPAITEQDFPYSVTYRLNGETKTFEGVYNCRLTSLGQGTDPLARYYEGTYLTVSSENHPAAYTIAEKDDLELCIVTIFSNAYLMGEPEAGFPYDPYLAVMDPDGMEYTEEEYLSLFDAELISWQMTEPVVNSFQFAGFSYLHEDSMIAMLIVGVLVLFSSMIFVKRDKTIPYKALDKVSIFFNILIAVAFIPFVALTAWLSQIFMAGSEWTYQLELCIPAITAFSVAASLSLRRKGFRKPGFFIQFVGPVLFALLLILE